MSVPPKLYGAQLLRRYRQMKGLSLREFGKRVRLSDACISRKENGHLDISVALVAQIAREHGEHPAAFFEPQVGDAHFFRGDEDVA